MEGTEAQSPPPYDADIVHHTTPRTHHGRSAVVKAGVVEIASLDSMLRGPSVPPTDNPPTTLTPVVDPPSASASSAAPLASTVLAPAFVLSPATAAAIPQDKEDVPPQNNNNSATPPQQQQQPACRRNSLREDPLCPIQHTSRHPVRTPPETVNFANFANFALPSAPPPLGEAEPARVPARRHPPPLRCFRAPSSRTESGKGEEGGSNTEKRRVKKVVAPFQLCASKNRFSLRVRAVPARVLCIFTPLPPTTSGLRSPKS